MLIFFSAGMNFTFVAFFYLPKAPPKGETLLSGYSIDASIHQFHKKKSIGCPTTNYIRKLRTIHQFTITGGVFFPLFNYCREHEVRVFIIILPF